MKGPFFDFSKLFKKKSSDKEDKPARAPPSSTRPAVNFRAFPERFADVFVKKGKKGNDEAATTSDDKVFSSKTTEEPQLVTSSSYVARLVNEVRDNFAAPRVAVPVEDPTECSPTGRIVVGGGRKDNIRRVPGFVKDAEKKYPDADVKALKLEIMATPLSTTLRYPDHAGNQKAMDNAVASGVKIRDFAYSPETPVAVTVLKDGTILDERNPVVFDARSKYMEFMYILYVTCTMGLFDIPCVHLSPMDVYRLFVLRWIATEDFIQFAFGRMLLGRGLWENIQRRRGGSSPPLYPWTIAANTQKPTEKECDTYRIKTDISRWKGTRYSIMWRETDKPAYDEKWDTRHLHEHGILGLKKLGIDNKLSLSLLQKRDPSFVGPDRALVHPAPGKGINGYSHMKINKTTAPMFPKVSALPVPFAPPEPLFVFPVSIEYNTQPTNEPTEDNATSTTASATPDASVERAPTSVAPSASVANNSSATVTDQPSEAKGKKRDRSEGPDAEEGDGPARRTRARISREEVAAAPPSRNLRVHRSVQTDHQPTVPRTREAIRVPQDVPKPVDVANKDKGKKRARGDSPEEDADLKETTPAKKVKTTTASTTPSGNASEASESHTTSVAAIQRDKGKKRARDDSLEGEADSTPTKKLKAATGTATPSASESEQPHTPDSTNVDASVVIASGSSSPPPAQELQVVQRPRRRAAPLRRHHMMIRRYYGSSDNDKEEGPSSRPSRRNSRSRSPSPSGQFIWEPFPSGPFPPCEELGLQDGDEGRRLSPEREREITAEQLTKMYEEYIAQKAALEAESKERQRQKAKRLREQGRRDRLIQRIFDGDEVEEEGEDDDDDDDDDDDEDEDEDDDDHGADHFDGSGGGGDDDDDDTPGDSPDGAAVASTSSSTQITVAPRPSLANIRELYNRRLEPARSRAPAPAPAPAPARDRTPEPTHAPTQLIGNAPAGRGLRRHNSFVYGEKVYKNKGAAFGALTARGQPMRDAVPTDLWHHYGMDNADVREKILPGLSSYNAPLSQREVRDREATLDRYREQMRQAEEHARNSREEEEEIEELITDGARLGMAHRLLDRKEEEEEEEEEPYEGKGKGKAKPRDPRRRK